MSKWKVFSFFFKKEEPIIAGKRWVIWSKASPWPPSNESDYATILDAKEGWVRYSIGKGEIFGDERMKESIFRHCYKPIKP